MLKVLVTYFDTKLMLSFPSIFSPILWYWIVQHFADSVYDTAE